MPGSKHINVMKSFLRSVDLPRVVFGTLVVGLLASCSQPQRTLDEPLAAPPSQIQEPPPIEAGVAPPPGPYAPGFDALHYDVSLALPDTGSFIRGRALVTIELTGARRDTLPLDLTGLAVDQVVVNGDAVGFRQHQGKLLVPVPADANEDRAFDVEIAYRGHPDDGLIIGRNVHGEPTAFADNWPNRARYWFPSIDHPSDKASVKFSVTLDEGDPREVIATGERVDDGWVYATDVPIPTYTMVVGVADFEIDTVGEVCRESQCTEVTTWLFPPDAHEGAASFRRADEMLRFYIDLIAPFPYEKLAHVQSSTRFGGMENVTAIFYSEQAIAEGRNIEGTVAHETAHQWFGDAVTEADWHHLWLSEGFADYFEALFFEHADGVERFREIMETARLTYLRSGAAQLPIVNPEQDNLFQLLNANNYQKGAWVLHMLRSRLGDDDFFAGIRDYYRTYEHETVLTEDLQRKLEEASGEDLEQFFRQWVFEPGHPRLSIEWAWTGEAVNVAVRQIQPDDWPAFSFPLTLAFEGVDERRTVEIHERVDEFRLELAERPSSVIVDPDGELLKEIVSIDETSMQQESR